MKDGGQSSQGFIYLSAKRLLDIVFATLGLLIVSPVMILTALWVCLDSKGPVFYRQKRAGKDGVEFDILKFRTMHHMAEAATGPVWAMVSDDRVTRSGRVLRKLYLDELPQLINILRGDMSFVGPRPERAFFYPKCEEVIPGFSARLRVSPGLTGLAQINQGHHPSDGAVRRKFRYDMFYIRKRTFFLDLSIMFRTFGLLWREFREMWR